MSKFKDFLAKNQKPEKFTFTVGKRLVDHETGELKVFEIRGDLDGEVYNTIRRKSQIKNKQGKIIEYDNDKMNIQLIKEFCIEPNFKSADNVKDAGVNTPEELIKLVFTTTERQAFVNKINQFTDAGDSKEDGKDLGELMDEAKN